MLALLLYATVWLRPVAPQIGFALHRAEIAAEHCVNQDQPMSTCGGSCFLKKQLLAQEGQDSDELPIAPPVAEEDPRDLPLEFIFSSPEEQPDLAFGDVFDFPISPFLPSIFHPPSPGMVL